jgi:hypothetical protein
MPMAPTRRRSLGAKPKLERLAAAVPRRKVRRWREVMKRVLSGWET